MLWKIQGHEAVFFSKIFLYHTWSSLLTKDEGYISRLRGGQGQEETQKLPSEYAFEFLKTPPWLSRRCFLRYVIEPSER